MVKVQKLFAKTNLKILLYQRKRLPCRRIYGRAGAFFLYRVLAGGKGQLAPVGQGDVCRQVGGDFKLIGHRVTVIAPAAYNAPSRGIIGGFCPAQRFVRRRGNRQGAVRVPDAAHAAEQPAADKREELWIKTGYRSVRRRSGIPFIQERKIMSATNWNFQISLCK